MDGECVPVGVPPSLLTPLPTPPVPLLCLSSRVFSESNGTITFQVCVPRLIIHIYGKPEEEWSRSSSRRVESERRALLATPASFRARRSAKVPRLACTTARRTTLR